MRGSFVSFARATASAGALMLGTIAIAAAPAMAKDKEKEAAKPTVSPEFASVAGPVQKAVGEFQDKRAKLAPDEVKTQATALLATLAKIEGKVKSPLDQQVFGQWEYIAGSAAGDEATSTKGLKLMLASGLASHEQSVQISAQLGQNAYRAKDYPEAIKSLKVAAADPKAQDAIGEMLAASYESAGDPKNALDALKSFIAAHQAAGAPVNPEVYDFGVGIASRAKMIEDLAYWAKARVAANPTQRNWFDAAQLVRANIANASNQDMLDIGRLLDATGALSLEANIVGREYVIYLQSINPNLLPSEALRIKDQGVKAGALRADDSFVKDIETSARPRLAADNASLGRLSSDATAAPTSRVAVTAGNIYLSHKDWANADAMFTLALSKGVTDEDKPHVLIRLGMAQIGEGKAADAKATLAKVTGTQAGIAELWSIYADQAK